MNKIKFLISIWKMHEPNSIKSAAMIYLASVSNWNHWIIWNEKIEDENIDRFSARNEATATTKNNDEKIVFSIRRIRKWKRMQQVNYIDDTRT